MLEKLENKSKSEIDNDFNDPAALQYDCETIEKRIDLLNRYFLCRIDKIDRKDICLSAAVDAIESNIGNF